MARPRQISDDELLAHARDVFLEHGASASTNLVAKACGMSQAALFKRFGDKRTLLLAALLPAGRPPFLDTLAAGPTDGPLAPQLIAIGTEVLGYLRQMVPCVTTLSAAGISPESVMGQYDVPPPLLAVAHLSQWFALAGDRLKPNKPEHLALQFLGGLHIRAFTLHLQRNHPDLGTMLGEPEPYITSMVHTFLEGVER